MPSFKAGDKEYLVVVDGPKIRRIRETCKTDDGKPFDPVARDASGFEALSSDPLLVQDVLWVVCEKQAKENGLNTKDQFDSLLCGECAENAANALIDAVIDFFPPRQRDVLRQMVATNRAATLAIHEAAMARVKDPKLAETLASKAIAEVNKAFDKLLR